MPFKFSQPANGGLASLFYQIVSLVALLFAQLASFVDVYLVRGSLFGVWRWRYSQTMWKLIDPYSMAAGSKRELRC